MNVIAKASKLIQSVRGEYESINRRIANIKRLVNISTSNFFTQETCQLVAL